ncbi:MAG TPA: hypothetical protein VMG10_12935 [Gemmataceae bacterium]|nr:hypothetical protein [Gemmataceae bacterium]
MIHFDIARDERRAFAEAAMTVKSEVFDAVLSEQELAAESAKDQVANSLAIIRRHEGLDHDLGE